MRSNGTHDPTASRPHRMMRTHSAWHVTRCPSCQGQGSPPLPSTSLPVQHTLLPVTWRVYSQCVACDTLPLLVTVARIMSPSMASMSGPRYDRPSSKKFPLPSYTDTQHGRYTCSSVQPLRGPIHHQPQRTRPPLRSHSDMVTTRETRGEHSRGGQRTANGGARQGGQSTGVACMKRRATMLLIR